MQKKKKNRRKKKEEKSVFVQVELSKLNPDKAYIQITFAEPYFDNYGESGSCNFTFTDNLTLF